MKRPIAVALVVLLVGTGAYAQLPPPTNLTAQLLTGSSPHVILTWQASGNGLLFKVYRSLGDSSHFQQLIILPLRAFDDTQVEFGRTYYYYVTSLAFQDTAMVESARSNIAVAAIPLPPAGSRGAVTGTITNDSTGAGIANIRVRFFRLTPPFMGVPSVATDSQGHFIAMVDTGSYLLQAVQDSITPGVRPYQSEWYNNAPTPLTATPVVVMSSDTAHASLGLSRTPPRVPAVINGVVRDSTGAGLDSALVLIVRSLQEMTQLAATTGHTPGLGEEERFIPGLGYLRGVIWSGRTNAQGEYHAEVSSGGEYVALAWKPGYVIQFFDHKSDLTQANIIHLRSDTTGIDFALRARRSSTNSIQGTVKDSLGVAVPSRVILFPRPPGSAPTNSVVVHTDSNGIFQATDLPQASYAILAIPYSDYSPAFFKNGSFGIQYWQDADTVVVAGIVSGIDIGAMRVNSVGLTRISGRITSQNGHPIVGGRVTATSTQGNVLGYGISDAAGLYAIDAVAAGEVHLSVDQIGLNRQLSLITVPPQTFTIENIDFVLTLVPPADVEEGRVLPPHVQLDQNYPNPFNPRTIITYHLPAASKVKLRVFDLLGREVAVLVSENQERGTYVVTFAAEQIASGVLYYRLEAGQFAEIRKMILIR